MPREKDFVPSCASFSELVDDELARARKLYPEPFNSAHEAYAVLLEEVRELEREVFLNPQKRNPQRMVDELVQVAAMALKWAEDIHGIPTE